MYFLSGPVTVPITFMVRPGCIVIRPRVPGGKEILEAPKYCVLLLVSLISADPVLLGGEHDPTSLVSASDNIVFFILRALVL